MATEAIQGVTVVNSATHLDDNAKGTVVVAGSQASAGPVYRAGMAGARALIADDTGVGKDQAGIAGLAYGQSLGMAVAAFDWRTARISDGKDIMARGKISHANDIAASCGVKAGMSVREAAALLTRAPMPTGTPSAADEAQRYLLHEAHGIKVWGLDTTGLITPEDEGAIILTGSHGGLVGGDPRSATRGVKVRAAVFHDAGICPDGSSTSRLDALNTIGVPAATVSAASARISDARSVYEDGELSLINEAALQEGAEVGMKARDFVDLIIKLA